MKGAAGCGGVRRVMRWWVALLLAAAASAFAAPAKIVLIGGPRGEAPGRHEYAAGIERIAAALLASGASGQPLRIERHPAGWPADARSLQGAAAVLLYFDGDTRHPLLDAERRREFDALMQRGAGLVVLHQASTLPAGDAAAAMQRWLGGVRVGLADRSTQTATVFPSPHAVTRGVAPFAYRDEFYPTLRFAARGVTPVLAAELSVQFSAGASVVDDWPVQATVGWAFQREGGGRSFGYTGAHFLAALDEPMLRRTIVQAVLWTARLVGDSAPAAAAPALQPSPADVTTFHRDAQRSGWQRDQKVLTPPSVSGGGFGLLWQSPPLHADGEMPPRLYATPLYLDRVRLTGGAHRGTVASVVFAATSNGDVYAVNAAPAGDLPPGRVLWRTKLGPACRLQPAPLDAVATGVLSTPVIDATRGVLYVTHCHPQQRWQAYALDIGSGAVRPGWPVRLDEPALNAVNRNAGSQPVPPRRRFDFRVQRGALNLSPDGSRLYVTFGETETGWLVSVDTVNARIASAFASAAMPHRGSGGLWGAGGPAVDESGRIYVATGSGFDGYLDQPADWTQSLLQLRDDAAGLALAGTYTPFNHCGSAKMDIDLGSGGVALLPSGLLAIGGKQGNAYLLKRDRLPGRLDRRPPCSTDAASDASLLPPVAQPQYGTRGPLNVFGPYSEADAALDTARARSLPAAFRGADGKLALFMTGTTRAGPGSPVSVAPSLVKLTVEDEAGPSPYLRKALTQDDIVFANPGSPVVSSDGAANAVVWVLDENAPRSAPLAGAGAPQPVLYALDAGTLALLWRSAPGLLATSGKYNEPLLAGEQVIVGTDRIQAFGLGAAAAATATAPAPAKAGGDAAAVAGTGGDAVATWRQRCAICHDQAQGNVPPRALISRRPAARIVEVLTNGAMRPQAAGLTAGEIEALANWLASEGAK